MCFAQSTGPNSDKMSLKSRCIFIGYPSNKKGYKLFDLESQSILYIRDVTFKEQRFPFNPTHFKACHMPSASPPPYPLLLLKT